MPSPELECTVPIDGGPLDILRSRRCAVFVRSTLGEVGLVTAFLPATYKARLFSTSAEALVLRRYYMVRRASFNSATKGH